MRPHLLGAQSWAQRVQGGADQPGLALRGHLPGRWVNGSLVSFKVVVSRGWSLFRLSEAREQRELFLQERSWGEVESHPDQSQGLEGGLMIGAEWAYV